MTSTQSPPEQDPTPPRGAWEKATEHPSGRAPSHGVSPLKRAIHSAAVKLLRAAPRPLVRIAASPYIAGEKRSDALRTVDGLHARENLLSTCDVLGEDVTSDADIQLYHDEFEALIRDLGSRAEYANVSIKLSALGQLIDEELCYQRMRQLMVLAGEHGQFMRIDMEDHTTTDSTLRIYRRLRSEGLDHCGVVLQSRLYRTREDIVALEELRPNVRLCIGIYREPSAIALQDKVAMKKHLLELLEKMWLNGQHVAVATHEEWVIREALDVAQRLGRPMPEVEVQMLLGVPRLPLQRELISEGVKVRLYVPYGEQWHAYSMRRLENNPDMLGMVAANVLTRPFRRH
jgi:proline dehydrogenase